MSRYFFFFFLSFLLVSCIVNAQGLKLNHHTIQEGSSQDPVGNHTSYTLSFSSDSNLEPFINFLITDHGKPRLSDNIYSWEGSIIEEVSSSSIDLRIKRTDINSPLGNWSVLFFYLNSGGDDLLSPGTNSQKEFKSYLQEIVDKTLIK